MTHPLASGSVAEASASDGAAAKAMEVKKWNKYARLHEGAFEFVPLAHETFGRAGPAAYRFLNRIADVAASSGSVCRRTFLRHAMQDLSATLCRGVAAQVRGSAPFLGRLAGKPVLPGLSVPSDDLVSLECQAGA